MSRVRDALKRANGIQTSTEIHDEPPRALGTALLEVTFGPESSAPANDPEGDTTSEPAPKHNPLLRWKWVRKMLRLAGIRTSGPVPKCQGTTRSGLPCRGPAMANGFCRLHGGSRRRPAAEKVHSLLDRVIAARESTSA